MNFFSYKYNKNIKRINMNEDIIINDNNDIIKVFIKLEFSETKIQNLYEINKSRKIITIYDTEN